MAYYFSAKISMINPEVYQQYLDEAEEIFNRFNGTYLAVDKSPKLLEGHWDYSRSVLIAFRSKADFEAWYYSIDYQRILKYRLAGARCDTILIQGLE